MHMKRNVLAAGLVAGSMLFAGAVHAGAYTDWTEDTYVGWDIVKAMVTYDTQGDVAYNRIYEDSFTGVDLYVGYRYSPMWSVEFGYMGTGSEDRTVNTNTLDSMADLITGSSDAKVSLWHLDGVGTYEFMDNFELMGSVGVERTKLKLSHSLTLPVTATAAVKRSDQDTAWRAGLGLGYNYGDFGVHVDYRYADHDFGGIAGGIAYYGLGLTYDF